MKPICMGRDVSTIEHELKGAKSAVDGAEKAVKKAVDVVVALERELSDIRHMASIKKTLATYLRGFAEDLERGDDHALNIMRKADRFYRSSEIEVQFDVASHKGRLNATMTLPHFVLEDA